MGRRPYETPEERELRLLREQSAARDMRRSQTITRGELLDAIDLTMFERGGNVGDAHDAVMAALRALRDAIE